MDEKKSANGYQVGGSHYKTPYEHWDLVITIPLSYLEGCATKYVCRLHKKSTQPDNLRKALHFLNKIEESTPRPPKRDLTFAETTLEVACFAVANGFDGAERRFIEILATWQTKEDLDEARTILFLMLDEAQGLSPTTGPVPLTEENHHAERTKDITGW